MKPRPSTGMEEACTVVRQQESNINTSCNNNSEDVENTCTDKGRTKPLRPNSLPSERAGELDFLSQSLDRDTFLRKRSATVAEVKEHATTRMIDELQKAQQELKLKDEQCEKLSKLRTEIEAEVEELTASLFEEAHSMVHDANVKRESSEKLLAEANGKIEVLTAEVSALKALVLTSTPSAPNKHMHPQLSEKPKNGSTFFRGHKRSPSHNDIKRSSSFKGWWEQTAQPATSTSLPSSSAAPQPIATSGIANFTSPISTIATHLDIPHPTLSSAHNHENHLEESLDTFIEIDPVMYKLFCEWKLEPSLNISTAFLHHIYDEDINPCLKFGNELAQDVLQCIEENALTIEPIHGNPTCPSSTDDESQLLNKCSLTGDTRVCRHRMQLGSSSDSWHHICKLARDRIAAVCDFYTYIRYITQGLVKNTSRDVYIEVVRLRKQMALARLGVLNLP